jgi:hypothetical protein
MPRQPRTRQTDDSRPQRESTINDDLEPVDLAKPVIIGAARKTLTSENIDALCRAMDTPLTFEDACRVVGWKPRTVSGWARDGEDEDCNDPLKSELAQKLARVNMSGRRGKLMKLGFEQCEFDPKMTQFMLERLMPTMQVVKQLKHEVEVGPKKVTEDLSTLTDEELDAYNAAKHKMALAASNK